MTAAGTLGYVAPEVVYTGRATDKADVYSFGILALEVACGRRTWDDSLEMRLLRDWVWQLLQESGKLMDALDPVCCPPAIDLDQQHIRVKVLNCTDDNAGKIGEEALISHRPDQENIAKDWYSLQDQLKWQCVLHVALHRMWADYPSPANVGGYGEQTISSMSSSSSDGGMHDQEAGVEEVVKKESSAGAMEAHEEKATGVAEDIKSPPSDQDHPPADKHGGLDSSPSLPTGAMCPCWWGFYCKLPSSKPSSDIPEARAKQSLNASLSFSLSLPDAPNFWNWALP